MTLARQPWFPPKATPHLHTYDKSGSNTPLTFETLDDLSYFDNNKSQASTQLYALILGNAYCIEYATAFMQRSRKILQTFLVAMPFPIVHRTCILKSKFIYKKLLSQCNCFYYTPKLKIFFLYTCIYVHTYVKFNLMYLWYVTTDAISIKSACMERLTKVIPLNLLMKFIQIKPCPIVKTSNSSK